MRSLAALHAFHRAEILVGGHFVFLLRHVDVYDVAHCLLCVVGDADDCSFAVHFNPFVRFAVE